MTSDELSPVGPRQRRRFRAARRSAPGAPEVPAEVDPTETDSGAVPLDMPADGVPDVITDADALDAAVAALAAGSGPVAIDAERASGYRYGQRAYLVQLNRRGAGTVLIDPIACPDLSGLSAAIEDAEWVLHAATQDLPCLTELGLRPRRLFDTELGARLAGQPRVGLGAVVEHYLGVILAKEHSAADWSTRPLPEPWLRYAALDVELLVDLRDAVHADLQASGKLAWAQEEFHALLDFTGPPPRVDPWRRTSGMHRIRKARDLAVVRELWYARDALAAERDVSPGRILPDLTIVELAAAPTVTPAVIAETKELRPARRNSEVWVAAVARARALPSGSWPPTSLPSGAPPPIRSWAERDPAAARRLELVRATLTSLSEELAIPAENLITPDLMRRVLWFPPAGPAEVPAALSLAGARPWQVELIGPAIARSLEEHPPA